MQFLIVLSSNNPQGACFTNKFINIKYLLYITLTIADIMCTVMYKWKDEYYGSTKGYFARKWNK